MDKIFIYLFKQRVLHQICTKTLKNSLFSSEMPLRVELEDPHLQGHHELRSGDWSIREETRHTVARSARRGSRLYGRSAALCRTSQALAIEEDVDLKGIPQGRTYLSRPLIHLILLEFEDLHLPLTLVCNCLNTRLRHFFDSQGLIHILKALLPFLKGSSLQLQHGLCRLSAFACLLQIPLRLL